MTDPDTDLEAQGFELLGYRYRVRPSRPDHPPGRWIMTFDLELGRALDSPLLADTWEVERIYGRKKT